MFKKSHFFTVFSKITLFACVFCVVPVWAETTCDIDFTPVVGNSIQNGTPTPTNPVEIESVGTKVGNKYQISVMAGNQGVVDLGTLSWTTYSSSSGHVYVSSGIADRKSGIGYGYLEGYTQSTVAAGSMNDGMFAGGTSSSKLYIRDDRYTDATSFKKAMSGKMFYYQRTTDGSWIAPTIVTVYLDEPLRKVGDYADVLDYKNGTITRNVGVRVFNGTESIERYSSSNALIVPILPQAAGVSNTKAVLLSTNFVFNSSHTTTSSLLDGEMAMRSSGTQIFMRYESYTSDTINNFKSWLAQQYANGTPVTVYYPLATPVVEQIENWSCPVPISDIKIATTKYVETEFAPLDTALANAISVVDNVVTRTIAQAGQIATLQNTKQTRPSDDNECPAGKKCLLVTDETGTPHWYEIIDCEVVLPFTSLVGTGTDGQNFNGYNGKACTSEYFSNIEAPSVACQNNEWASVYENVVLYGTARAVNISESPGSIVRLPDNVQSGNVCVCNLGAYALVTTWDGRNSVFAPRVAVNTDKWLVTGSLNGATSTDCSTECAFSTQSQARSAYVLSVANTCGTEVPLASL